MSSELFRRTFLKGAAGAAGFTILRPELVRGAGNERLKAGVIGCGGRGTQAVVNLLTGTENVELVAMADVFEDHLEKSLANVRDPKYVETTVKRNGGPPPQLRVEDLVTAIPKKIKVDAEHHFVGFDAYQKLINSDVDIVLLTTPPGYRPMHFEAAINAKKHVFTEKPIATDPVGVRRFLAAAKKAEELKLTVVSGANRHADVSYKTMVKKIHDGEIGDVLALYAKYIINAPVVHADKRDPKWGDMEWQHRNWYSFIWICGDQIVEQHFHNIDLMNWVMGTHPIKVVASGGRAWRTSEEVWGNIYDHMCSDFEYPNGVRLSSHCRQYKGKGLCYEISDQVVGSKGRLGGAGLVSDVKGIDPYCQEHMDLVNSIRGTGPYLNQGKSVAESTMTAIMGRESAYSGQMITWDQIMASKLDLQPKAFDYKLEMTVPPVPVPGVYKFI